ncbi:MAG: hypothetical protein JW750_10065 [Anaerolineaceae bacterium]|nr:hypothetical protein [Anaerolineaceae bacterium]
MSMILALIGFFLTLMILSYLIGDNPLFRMATYLFVGISAGYVTVLIIYQVILPKLILPILIGDANDLIWLVIAWVMSLLLVMKLFPKVSRAGNIPLVYLAGVAAAVTIGGTLLGTVATQVMATMNLFDLRANASTGFWSLVEGVFILFGTSATLLYFYYGSSEKDGGTVGRSPFLKWMRVIGKVFIGLTLGAVFAGVYLSSVAALIDRMEFISNVFWSFF